MCTRRTLCRVPDKRHTAKVAFADGCLPCGLCRGLCRVQQAHGKVPVSCSVSDTEFADMMFLDGCFLLQLMESDDEPPLAGLAMSCGPSILKDIFLLENQIPWLVLEVLMQLRPMSSWTYLRAGL